jgi:glucose-6-phosphate-specific signal transduction histidine kinase
MIDRALDAWGAWCERTGRAAKVIINLATAALYLLAYLSLREASNDQWYLPAGLRFATLLVMPYRLWPALFVGEVAALSTFRVAMAAEFGWVYYAVSTILAWPIVACIVRRLRQATVLPRISSAADAISVIVAGILSAELVSLANKAASAYLRTGGGEMVYSDLFVYSLGHVQGILLAILTVALASRWAQTKTVNRSFAIESVGAVLTCGALAWMVSAAEPHDATGLMALRLCMLLPSVALTFRHGWQGAALGSCSANIALFATIPHQEAGQVDGPALLMQEAFAFIAASLFVLGSRMQQFDSAAASTVEDSDDRRHAREQFEAQERRHREAALRAEAMQRDSRESMRPVISLLRKSGQAEAAMSLVGMAHRQTSQFERQVVDSIYPLTLERFGFFAAVESEAFAARFGGTPFRLDLTGAPRAMGISTTLAAYRVLGEAIEHLVQFAPASISVRIHCAVKADGCGIVSMSIRALEPSIVGRSSAQTARMAQLRNHVMAYGGSRHNRAHRLRLIVLDEAMQASVAVAAAPSSITNVHELRSASLLH